MRWPHHAATLLLGALAGAALSVPGCGARSTLSRPERPDRVAVCGDHVAHDGEPCDDGNDAPTDACVACALARCGDGVVHASVEACDDGGTNDEDGCRNDCSLPTCGDGIVDPGEACDDGNADDTDACPSLCLFAICGDGFVQAGAEACDLGPSNTDRPAFLLTQGALSRPVLPLLRGVGAAAFYDYHSASGHTGLELARESRLYLYADTSTGALSLFTHHGIDIDTTGVVQPDAQVRQTFLHLPAGTFVSVRDDKIEEFDMDTDTSAVADWNFHENTDGGVLSGLPYPGAFSIDIDIELLHGIETWAYLDGGEAPITLDPAETANLTAFGSPSACRTDCTVPRCGDGRLDGGEVCDDGNASPGDGCAADCRSFGP